MAYSICEPQCNAGRDAILELWRRNLPESTEARYQWLYNDGPATAWLLASDEGDIVGGTGLMARTIHLRGRTLRAAQAIDLNVDRRHRTIGPALKLQRTVTATVDDGRFDLVYAFPNPDSELVQRRVGYKALGIFGRWAKPLRCGEDMKGWFRYPVLGKAASTVLDLGLRLRWPEALRRRPAPLRVEVTDRFDARFDALWEEAAGQFGVIGQRTSGYLEWRFRRSPAARHRVFCLCGPDRRLLAYLVYCRREGNVFISDFLFRREEEFNILLADFIRLARREKAVALITVYLGSEAVTRTLARFGFLKRPSSWQTLVYVNPDGLQPDAVRLLDPASWHLTRADVDTDF